MKPTVRNIAEKAGVSTASVSMVLNQKPSRITEATKARIVEAARELGYSFEERVEKEKRGTLIGVIRPDSYSELVDSCLKGIGQYAYVHAYEIVTCDAAGSTEQAIEGIRVLDGLGAAGFVVMPPMDMNENGHNEELGAVLHGTGKPFLLLDEAVNQVFCDFITADHKGGAYMAVEYLIHYGHQEIGILAGKKGTYTSRKHVEGYKEALVFCDFLIRESHIIYGNCDVQSGYEGMRQLWDYGVRAVFVTSEKAALGVYRFARENRIVIGEELSVIGFNEFAAASILSPALTTISQPGDLMGKKACELLMKRIDGEDKDPIRTAYFSPQLMERDSVKNRNSSEE